MLANLVPNQQTTLFTALTGFERSEMRARNVRKCIWKGGNLF